MSRAVHGTEALWGDTEHLLAAIADAVRAAVWQRGGGKGPKPRPLPRPVAIDPDRERFGNRSIPLSEAAAFFAAWREGAYAGGDN